jgi:hypothetical protein
MNFWWIITLQNIGLIFKNIFFTTRNYFICDTFSATFSENITNVHCSPEHCDDLSNSSRFYDVFLFFVTDVHWSPKHCDVLFNLSRFYDVFLFFVTNTATICLICRDSTTYSYFYFRRLFFMTRYAKSHKSILLAGRQYFSHVNLARLRLVLL